MLLLKGCVKVFDNQNNLVSPTCTNDYDDDNQWGFTIKAKPKLLTTGRYLSVTRQSSRGRLDQTSTYTDRYIVITNLLSLPDIKLENIELQLDNKLSGRVESYQVFNKFCRFIINPNVNS